MKKAWRNVRKTEFEIVIISGLEECREYIIKRYIEEINIIKIERSF